MDQDQLLDEIRRKAMDDLKKDGLKMGCENGKLFFAEPLWLFFESHNPNKSKLNRIFITKAKNRREVKQNMILCFTFFAYLYWILFFSAKNARI